MARSVDELKAVINKRNGLARPNQFMVELPSQDARTVNVLCTRVNLPGKQILTHERRIGMEFEKTAYGYAVDDVSMSFLLTNDYGIKKFFDNWKSIIINEETMEVGYKSDYQRTVKIHQLKRPIPNVSAGVDLGIFGQAGFTVRYGADTVYSVELKNAFPTTLQALELTNELDGFLEFTVQLSYTNWREINDVAEYGSVTVQKPTLPKLPFKI